MIAIAKLAFWMVVILLSGVVAGILTERIAMQSCRCWLGGNGHGHGHHWNMATKVIVSCQVVHLLFLCTCRDGATFPFYEGCLMDQANNNGVNRMMCWQLLGRVLLFCLGARFGSALQPVGLTGGIATGKSTVSNILSGSSSFKIIDVDAIAHDVLDPTKLKKDSAYFKLVQAFGDYDILDTTATGATTTAAAAAGGGGEYPNIDRRKLGELVFQDRAKRKILNGITHPLITKIMLRSIVRNKFPWRSEATVVCVDVPLLFEGGIPMKLLFGWKVTVACSPSLQLKRLRSRDTDLSPTQCQERMASQMSLEKKSRMSDLVIRNDGDREDLRKNVEMAKQEILRRVVGWNVYLDQLVLLMSLVWGAALIVFRQ